MLKRCVNRSVKCDVGGKLNVPITPLPASPFSLRVSMTLSTCVTFHLCRSRSPWTHCNHWFLHLPDLSVPPIPKFTALCHSSPRHQKEYLLRSLPVPLLPPCLKLLSTPLFPLRWPLTAPGRSATQLRGSTVPHPGHRLPLPGVGF